jgi:acyl-homoserine lactone acylase PvdQ
MKETTNWRTGVQFISFVWLAIFLPLNSLTKADDPSAKTLSGRTQAWAKSGTIYRDAFGVPHIFAVTDAA